MRGLLLVLSGLGLGGCGSDTACKDIKVWYEDRDADGYGAEADLLQACAQPVGYVDNADDCNDRDGTVYPGADEICGDGLDNNCDGVVDDCPLFMAP